MGTESSRESHIFLAVLLTVERQSFSRSFYPSSLSRRFFPVISNDMKLMSQSIQTRGAFSGIWEKTRFFPEYIEILIVPLSLRVIRIAETLSASAETRGIDLKCKRNSFVSLRFGIWDIVVLVLVVSAVITGLTI